MAIRSAPLCVLLNAFKYDTPFPKKSTAEIGLSFFNKEMQGAKCLVLQELNYSAPLQAG